MSTICLAIKNEGFLSNYPNRGTSEDAHVFDRFITDKWTEYAVSYSDSLQNLYAIFKNHAVKNWDGYGANAADLISFMDAIKFLLLLPSSIPSPEIGLDPQGEFIFNWIVDRKNLFSIIFDRNSNLIYAGLYDSSKANGVEYFEDELPKPILDNIQRLYSQTC